MYSVEADSLRLPCSRGGNVITATSCSEGPYSSSVYDIHSSLSTSASVLNHGSEYHGESSSIHSEFQPAAGSTPLHPGAHDHQPGSTPQHPAIHDHQPTSSFDHSLVDYKSEPPATPTYSQPEHIMSGYPTSFTPSPSSHGSASDSPPPSSANMHHIPSPPSSAPHDLHASQYFFNLQHAGSALTGQEGPYPAPTPPLSASHHTKDANVEMVLSSETNILMDTSGSGGVGGGVVGPWTEEQKGCICDSLQNNNEIDKLGKIFLYFSLIMFLYSR